MRQWPEPGKEVGHGRGVVAAEQAGDVQFAQAHAGPQQGQREYGEQQARQCGGVVGAFAQHRGICTTTGLVGAMEASSMPSWSLA
ncbi:hypothetical protein D9M71_792700 [compost metagenome]